MVVLPDADVYADVYFQVRENGGGRLFSTPKPRERHGTPHTAALLRPHDAPPPSALVGTRVRAGPPGLRSPRRIRRFGFAATDRGGSCSSAPRVSSSARVRHLRVRR